MYTNDTPPLLLYRIVFSTPKNAPEGYGQKNFTPTKFHIPEKNGLSPTKISCPDEVKVRVTVSIPGQWAHCGASALRPTANQPSRSKPSKAKAVLGSSMAKDGFFVAFRRSP
jgi:hypothetical protein